MTLHLLLTELTLEETSSLEIRGFCCILEFADLFSASNFIDIPSTELFAVNFQFNLKPHAAFAAPALI